MSEEYEQIGPELAAIESAMRRLAPQPTTLSRDVLLFEAGKAAAQPRIPAWTWPASTVFFAMLAATLGAFLITPSDRSEIRYQTQYVFTKELPAAPNDVPSLTAPSAAETVKIDPAHADLAKMLRVRRDVLRFGIDALPPSTAPDDGPSPVLTAKDLNRWLNLPPGTFATPPLPRPKKSDPEEDK